MSDAAGPLVHEPACPSGSEKTLAGSGGDRAGPVAGGASERDAHRVGPNAIIKTRIALIGVCGADQARNLFAAAGLATWFDAPPDGMVPARAVDRLNRTLMAQLDGARFEALMVDAGARTGRYILENRIPAPARFLLQGLPAGLAARALLNAIRANAWTFAGKARVAVVPGHPAIIEIRGNPISVPGCPWHRAVFATLFASLLCKPIHVDHRASFDGQPLDRFSVHWKP